MKLIFYILIMMLIFLLIPTLIMILNNLLSKKIIMMSEKTSPFECGFLSFFNNQMPISMNFFMISILFIIFDVEIAFMFPMITSIYFSNQYNYWLSIFCFLTIILIGFFYEWYQSMLNWK